MKNYGENKIIFKISFKGGFDDLNIFLNPLLMRYRTIIEKNYAKCLKNNSHELL
jgi:hypothetical protein